MLQKEQKSVQIYTDGSCLGNPGPGGWAALLIYEGHKKSIYGCAACATNNQMEIRAALEGLKMLKEPCKVDLYTDSQYLKNAATQWIWGWIKNNWRTSGKTPVLNKELWLELLPLLEQHKITWHWVRGHQGHPENEHVDALARKAAETQTSLSS